MRDIALALVVTGSLAACMGDGTLFVTGQLRSETGAALQACKIQLQSQAFDTAEIDPMGFTQDFVVAPREAKYPLLVSCAGHESYLSSVSYVPGNSNTTNLGRITLRASRGGT